MENLFQNGAKFQVRWVKTFKQDLKRVHKSQFDVSKLLDIVSLLANGKILPISCQNHPLHGSWQGFEECHIESNWILIYKKYEAERVIMLERTGTHAQLFGR